MRKNVTLGNEGQGQPGVLPWGTLMTAVPTERDPFVFFRILLIETKYRVVFLVELSGRFLWTLPTKAENERPNHQKVRHK